MAFNGHAHKTGWTMFCWPLPNLFCISLICLLPSLSATIAAYDVIACQSEYFYASCSTSSSSPSPHPSIMSITHERPYDEQQQRQQHDFQGYLKSNKNNDNNNKNSNNNNYNNNDNNNNNDTSNMQPSSKRDSRFEVIIVEFAMFGRMNHSRCVKKSFGHVGCWNDVTEFFVRLCNYRFDCGLKVIGRSMVGRTIRACPVDLKSYLHVRYRCLKTTIPSCKPQTTTDRAMRVDFSETFSNLAILEFGCRATTEWKMETRRGDKMILIIFHSDSSLDNFNIPRSNESILPSVGDELPRSSVDDGNIFQEKVTREQFGWLDDKRGSRLDGTAGGKDRWEVQSDKNDKHESTVHQRFNKNQSYDLDIRINSNSFTVDDTMNRGERCVVYAKVYDEPPSTEKSKDIFPIMLLYNGRLVASIKYERDVKTWSDLKICSEYSNHLKDSRIETEDKEEDEEGLINKPRRVPMELLSALRTIDKISRNSLNLIYVSAGSEIILRLVETTIPFLLQFRVLEMEKSTSTMAECKDCESDGALLLKSPSHSINDIKIENKYFYMYISFACCLIFIFFLAIVFVVYFLRGEHLYNDEELKERCYEFSMTEEKLEKRLRGYTFDAERRFPGSETSNRSTDRHDFQSLQCRLCRDEIETVFLTLSCSCLSPLQREHPIKNRSTDSFRRLKRNFFDRFLPQEIRCPLFRVHTIREDLYTREMEEETRSAIQTCPLCHNQQSFGLTVFDSFKDLVSKESLSTRRSNGAAVIAPGKKEIFGKPMIRKEGENYDHDLNPFHKCALCRTESKRPHQMKICDLRCQSHHPCINNISFQHCERHCYLDQSDETSCDTPSLMDKNLELDWKESIRSNESGNSCNEII